MEGVWVWCQGGNGRSVVVVEERERKGCWFGGERELMESVRLWWEGGMEGVCVWCTRGNGRSVGVMEDREWKGCWCGGEFELM